jgi:hypothetical protein
MTKILTWLRHFAAIEPVYVRSLIGTFVVVAGVWGLDLADVGGRVGTTIEQVILALGLVFTVLGIRSAVTPSNVVVARVEDAADPLDAVYLAGDAAEPPTGAVVSRHESLHTLRVGDLGY